MPPGEGDKGRRPQPPNQPPSASTEKLLRLTEEITDSMREDGDVSGEDHAGTERDPDEVDTLSGQLNAITAVVAERTEANPEQTALLQRAAQIEQRVLARTLGVGIPESGEAEPVNMDLALGERRSSTDRVAFEAMLRAEIQRKGWDVFNWKQAYQFVQLDDRDLKPAEQRARLVMKLKFVEPILRAVQERWPAVSELLDTLSSGYAMELARAELRATYDELTGLINSREALRDMLRLEVDRFIHEADLDEVMVTIELDFIKFKHLNNALGEARVDEEILKPAGAKLRHPRSLRAEDLKARFGGDEMTIVLTKIHKNDVSDVLQRIKAILEEDNTVLDNDLANALQQEAAYDPEVVTNNAIKVRIGARIWSKEEIAQWNMDDATKFVNLQLRRDALLATHAAKKLPDQDIVIWDADNSAGSGVSLDEQMLEVAMRAISTTLVDVRKVQGPAAADELEKTIREAFQRAMSQNKSGESEGSS